MYWVVYFMVFFWLPLIQHSNIHRSLLTENSMVYHHMCVEPSLLLKCGVQIYLIYSKQSRNNQNIDSSKVKILFPNKFCLTMMLRISKNGEIARWWRSAKWMRLMANCEYGTNSNSKDYTFNIGKKKKIVFENHCFEKYLKICKKIKSIYLPCTFQCYCKVIKFLFVYVYSRLRANCWKFDSQMQCKI